MLGAVELIAALLAYKIWTGPFRLFGVHGYWEPFFIFANVSSLLVLVFPLAALIFIYKDKRWGFLFLAGFPLVCLLFGVTAFPFVSLLYGNDIAVKSMYMSIINSLVCMAAMWFYVSSSGTFEKSPQQD